MSDLTFQEIVPGVHAVLGGICNRGLIAAAGSGLVVDSGISVAEAAPLRAAAQAAQERQKGGALHLFNTHLHSDHVYGNQVFAGWWTHRDPLVRTTVSAPAVDMPTVAQSPLSPAKGNGAPSRYFETAYD